MISILKNKKNFIYLFIFFLLIITFPLDIKSASDTKKTVNIYFFHSNDCSHCKSEEKFLKSLEERNNNIKIYRYEIHKDKNNELRKTIQKLYKIKTNGIPLTIIGDTPYSGYIEEKSDRIFIKTIEYYSRYGYKDKVGELLNLEIPQSKLDQNAPTLEEFIKEYGNYQIIGKLSTDDLDLSTTTIILSALSQLNLIRIISIIIALILISNLKDTKTQIFLLTLYIGLIFFINSIYIIDNNTYTLIIKNLTIILIIISLINYIKNKQTQNNYNNILIIITIASIWLENYLFPSYLKNFKEILNLYNLNRFSKAYYYSNYFFIILTINILLFLLFYTIKKSIIKEKIS